MLQTYPKYYTEFSCIADKCTDNCCIGWEIQVDKDTLKKYQTLEGKTGEDVRAHLKYNSDGNAAFEMNGNRCPMLNDDNLCRLILDHGEDILCEICTQHPRFHNLYGAERESGLGLCCPEAARLILESDLPFKTTTSASEYITPTENTPEGFTELKAARNTAFTILQNRNAKIINRLAVLLAFGEDVQRHLSDENYSGIFDISQSYSSIENIDEFTDALKKQLITENTTVSEAITDIIDFFAALIPIDEVWHHKIHNTLPMDLYTNTPDDIYSEQLGCYFIYRYFLESAYDGDAKSKIVLAVIGCIMSVMLGGTTASAALLSKELEYCGENMDDFAEEVWTTQIFSTERLLKILLNDHNIHQKY